MRSSKGVIKSEQEVTDVTDTVSKALSLPVQQQQNKKSMYYS